MDRCAHDIAHYLGGDLVHSVSPCLSNSHLSQNVGFIPLKSILQSLSDFLSIINKFNGRRGLSLRLPLSDDGFRCDSFRCDLGNGDLFGSEDDLIQLHFLEFCGK